MTCPICHGETRQKFRPFCSKRCADLDLGKWLSGAYSVPSDDPDDPEAPALPEPAPMPKPH